MDDKLNKIVAHFYLTQTLRSNILKGKNEGKAGIPT